MINKGSDDYDGDERIHTCYKVVFDRKFVKLFDKRAYQRELYWLFFYQFLPIIQLWLIILDHLPILLSKFEFTNRWFQSDFEYFLFIYLVILIEMLLIGKGFTFFLFWKLLWERFYYRVYLESKIHRYRNWF